MSIQNSFMSRTCFTFTVNLSINHATISEKKKAEEKSGNIWIGNDEKGGTQHTCQHQFPRPWLHTRSRHVFSLIPRGFLFVTPPFAHSFFLPVGQNRSRRVWVPRSRSHVNAAIYEGWRLYFANGFASRFPDPRWLTFQKISGLLARASLVNHKCMQIIAPSALFYVLHPSECVYRKESERVDKRPRERTDRWKQDPKTLAW